MAEQKKCAHPSCNCTADKDSDYCGAYCEGRANTLSVTCSCGHDACEDHIPPREFR
jgi:hypothetical protein